MNNQNTNCEETIIVEKIIAEFKDNYKMQINNGGYLSIYLFNKCDIALNLDIESDDLLVWLNTDSKDNCDYVSLNYDYLDTLHKTLSKLNNQLNIFNDFIEGLILSINEDNDSWLYTMDLVKWRLYIKSKTRSEKAIIEPILSLYNDQNYCTFHVNGLDSHYPMKRFTSISYDDLKDDISFFVD